MQRVVRVGVHVQVYVQRCVPLGVQDVLHVLALVDLIVVKPVVQRVEIVQLLVQEAAEEVAQKHVVVIVLDNAMELVQDVEVIVHQHAFRIVLQVVTEDVLENVLISAKDVSVV